MSKITLLLNFLCCTTLLLNVNSFATNFDSVYVETLAKRYLQEKFTAPIDGKVSIEISKIDPRIIIKPCNIPLTVNIPEKQSGRNVNVKISCDESSQWQLFLPAKIRFTFPVLVAKTTIYKGSILDNSNVELIFLEENKIHSKKLTDINAILGGKAKKRLAQGIPINIKSICLVCKGDNVTIIASTGGFTIKTQGSALSSGNLNQQIRVKNKQTNKVITAQVKAINQVIINL